MNYRILLCSFIGSILWVACQKDALETCHEEVNFCRFVAEEDFQATGPAVDDFLASLRDNDENSLEKLRAWLQCKSCVEDAEIICNSCIYTLPAQSEILVTFNVKGEKIRQLMDISMSEPLKFSRYHE